MRASERVTLPPLPTAPTRLGLGGGPLGGLFRPVSEEQALAAVERAWQGGLRYFDVAPLYGHGRAERFVGEALKTKPRDQFVISTKVGRLLRPEAAARPSDFADTEGVGPIFDLTADGIRRSLEESLERLGLDRVDMVFIHDPEDHLDQALREAWPALERLRAEGIIDAGGVGTNHCATVARFAQEAAIDCALLANRSTLLDRSASEEVLPLCSERGIAVIAGGVYSSGILAAPGGEAAYEYAPAPADVRRQALRLEGICRSHGIPLVAAAIQFPFRYQAITAVLVGARSAEEVTAAIDAMNTSIPSTVWTALAEAM